MSSSYIQVDMIVYKRNSNTYQTLFENKMIYKIWLLDPQIVIHKILRI